MMDFHLVFNFHKYVGVKLKYPVLCWHGLGKESEMQMRWTYSFQLTLQRENNNPRSGSFPEKHCSKQFQIINPE